MLQSGPQTPFINCKENPAQNGHGAQHLTGGLLWNYPKGGGKPYRVALEAFHLCSTQNLPPRALPAPAEAHDPILSFSGQSILRGPGSIRIVLEISIWAHVSVVWGVWGVNEVQVFTVYLKWIPGHLSRNMLCH